ncbi:MAG: hypothetical protein WB810_12655, partial [Candidatus Cybelea sp.]
KRDAVAERVVNLGNPDEFTINELAGILSDVAGVPLETIACELPPDDPTRRRPDIGRARAQLGWEPKVALREGLSATLNYFRTAARGAETLAR